MLYPDSWHFYGCEYRINPEVVECDLPHSLYMYVQNNKTFSFIFLSLSLLSECSYTSLGST